MQKSNVNKPYHAFNPNRSIVAGWELPYKTALNCMSGGRDE